MQKVLTFFQKNSSMFDYVHTRRHKEYLANEAVKLMVL